MTDPFVDRIPASRLSLDPQLLGDGGQGWIYRVTAVGSRPLAQPLAYKRYKPRWLPQINAEALKDLVSLRHGLAHTSRQLLIERTAWPETVVEDEQGQPVGFLMPLLPNNFVQQLHVKVNGRDVYVRVEHLLNSDAYIRRMGIQISDGWRLGFLHDVAETIDLLHRNRVSVGDISPLNIYPSFGSAPRCFFVDCDAMQLNGRSVLPQAQTRGWEVPYHEKTATPHSDAYKLALLAVRLFARDQDTRDPTAVARCSWQLGDLAREGLNTTDPMSRPPPAQWIRVLQARARTSPHTVVGGVSVGAAPGDPVQPSPSGATAGQDGSLAQPSVPPRPQPRVQDRARRLRLGLVAALSLVSLFATALCLVGCIALIGSRLVADPQPKSPATVTPTSAPTPEPTPASNDSQTYNNQLYNRSCLQDGRPGIAMGNCNDLESTWGVHVLVDIPRKVTLANVATGRCLDDSTEHGLRTTDCDSSNPSRQIWLVTRWLDETIELKNQETQLCIEASDTNGLSSKNCDQSGAQSWF
jgi:Ricin-type beta-trefoil lectin domain